MNLPILAGMISTLLFAASNLPMLVKAARTKNLSSYSVGSMAMINVANAVHSVYVFSLPVGPIWVLHSFYLVASALMLVLCLRYRGPVRPPTATQLNTRQFTARRLMHQEA
jgi:uncharacterized protein with PQ loop repeat